MIKKGLALFTILLNVFLHFDLILACTCAPPGTPTEELQKSDAVFIGSVIDLTPVNRDQSGIFLFHKIKFEVKSSWKGVDLGEVIVTTAAQSGMCGFAFEQDSTYLVYAFAQGDSLLTNICTRTRSLSQAKEDLDEIGKPLVTAVEEGVPGTTIPQTSYLRQNYPNPFNPATRISYFTPTSSYVELKVYDLLGNEIQTLVDEIQAAGTYFALFDGSKLSSGVYFYKLRIGNPSPGTVTEVKKMLLMK